MVCALIFFFICRPDFGLDFLLLYDIAERDRYGDGFGGRLGQEF